MRMPLENREESIESCLLLLWCCGLSVSTNMVTASNEAAISLSKCKSTAKLVTVLDELQHLDLVVLILISLFLCS